MTTKFLDLDAVASNVDFSLKLNGKAHKLVEPSVDTFINNLKDVQSLSLSASPIEELEMSIKMILRSFPSIPEQELRDLRLTQIQAISDFARTAGGEAVENTAVPAEGAEGNDPAAT